MFDMVGSQRTVVLVLANGIGILCGIAESAFVEVRRPPAANVQHDQPNGTTDRGICSVAGTESICASIHADCACKIGPLTTTKGEAMWVVACTPLRLN